MKHGWEYTRFGDIIKPAKNVRNGVREKLPVLSITMRGGIVKQNDRFKKVIASRDTANYKVVKRGQLVIAFPIDEGLIYTQEVVEEGIMSPAYDVYDIDCTYINRQFLVKYFHCPQAMKYYKDKLRGTTQRRRMLPKEDLYALLIPVPPLPIQKQICSLLDKMNRVIEAKKEQLKELDNLAQAIFYDMFGDPVTNEKGWDVAKVIDVVKLQRGYDLPVQNRHSKGNIPIYGANGIVGYHTEAKMQYGIITGRSGSIGDVYMSKIPFWPLNTSLFSVDTHNNDIIFLMYLIKNYNLSRFKQGAGVPTLNRNSFHQNDIINVPLHLQQVFAEKVEAIERQKELINQSLREVQTLFDSRMDYWFSEEEDDFGQLDKSD